MWKTIWFHPRQTVRNHLERLKDSMMILIIAWLTGISIALDKSTEKNMGVLEGPQQILASSFFIGGILCILFWYLYSYLLSWTGRWLKGKANASEIRTILSFSFIPIVFSLILWVPRGLVLGDQTFIAEPAFNNSFQAGIYLSIVILDVILAFWSILSMVICLSELQGFSVWKAILNILIVALLFIGTPIFLSNLF